MEEYSRLSEVFPYFGAFVGACMGSFLNLCAYRVPQSLSIVRPGSRCVGCNRSIPWHLNVPVFGYLALRGRSQCCGTKIPLKYFLVELALAALYCWFFKEFTIHRDLGLFLAQSVFTWVLIGVMIIDMETMTIPDRFSMGGLFAGLFLSIAYPSIHSVVHHPLGLEHLQAGLQSILGIMAGTSLLYWIGALAGRAFGREALGEGDVKLLGCIGAFCGWQGAIFSIFAGAMIGCLFLLPSLVIGKAQKNENTPGWGREVPFGPYLALAGLLHFLFLSRLVKEWFNPFVDAIF